VFLAYKGGGSLKLKLLDLLHKKGISQSDLARQLDVSPIYISRWVNGKVLPSLTHFYAISKILKVKMENLIK
jgi:transcriptional regulator with XRE-family HTH domain